MAGGFLKSISLCLRTVTSGQLVGKGKTNWRITAETRTRKVVQNKNQFLMFRGSMMTCLELDGEGGGSA